MNNNKIMNFWIDDVRPAPDGFIHIHSVNEMLKHWDDDPNFDLYIGTISFDHDAGEYAKDGGDYINILNYMDKLFNEFFKNGGWNYNIKFHFHSANPVGVANMRRIIEKNGWTEVSSLEEV